jgi:hypothetical protein
MALLNFHKLQSLGRSDNLADIIDRNRLAIAY